MFIAPLRAAAATDFDYDPAGNLAGASPAPTNAEPAITGQPLTQVLAEDGSAHFTVVATGAGPLTYQWLSNGIPISGATGDSLVISNVVVPQNLLSNGGFESPFIVATYQTMPAGTYLDGWTVESGNADIVFTYMVPAAGRQSLDLNGTATGVVYQDVPTTPGQQYQLSYMHAGNAAAAPTFKTNTVSWNGALLDTNIFDITGHTVADMGWINREYLVTATSNLTRLRFASLVGGAYGPALDEVSLLAVQPPPIQYSVIVSNLGGSVTSSVATIEFDRDADGLPDSWERNHFGNTALLASTDSDGDGVSNGDEFLEGTSPTNAVSFRARLEMSARPGGTLLRAPFQPAYVLNDVVQLTATPDPGNFFLGWIGSVTNTNATVNVVMDGHKSVTALFALGLANGARHDGTLLANQTNTHGFFGNAGERVVLRIGELADGGAFDPKILLLSPTGVALGTSSGFAAAEIEVTLTNAGVFQVIVSDGASGGTSGTGDYQLHLARVPGAYTITPGDDGGNLVNGTNAFGTIDVGDLDQWSLSANAGDRLVLRVGQVSEGNPDFDPWIRLYDPNGLPVGSANGYAGAEIAAVATNSGTYTVLVGDAGLASPYYLSDPGTYHVYLAKLPGAFVVPAGDDGGTLVNGTNAPGMIETGDLDVWSFTASAGEFIKVRAAEVTDGNGDFDPWIRLFGPTGLQLGSALGFTAAEIEVTATNTGTFTVVMADGNAASPYYVSDAGTYQLRLAKAGAFVVPGSDEGGELLNGGNHAGTIVTGDLDMWSFPANTGDSLVVRVAEITDNLDFDPWIELIGPTGAQLATASGFTAAEITVTATNTGTFTVVVSDDNASNPYFYSDTGTYQLRLARMPAPFVVGDDGAMVVTAGTYPGTNDVGDLDQWGFWANKGNAISIQINEVTDDTTDYDPWIRLYSPSGILLNSVWGVASAVINRTATNSGFYRVLVSDGGASSPYYLSDSGTYSLTISNLTGPPQFTNLQLAATQLVVSGTGGPTNTPYVVVTSTNVTTPAALWSPLQTNTFNAAGAFVFTNAVNPTQRERYFRLVMP